MRPFPNALPVDRPDIAVPEWFVVVDKTLDLRVLQRSDV